MKITTITEVVVEHAMLTIKINPNNQDTSVVLTYTCPDCAGHGCRSHGNTRAGNQECSSGSVAVKINPAKIDIQLDQETSMKIKAAVQNLANELTGK